MRIFCFDIWKSFNQIMLNVGKLGRAKSVDI